LRNGGVRMDWREVHQRLMHSSRYRRAWERLEPEYQAARAFLALRTLRGWTQEQLAQRLGVSQSYVAKLESGRNITLRQLWRVARALGYSVELRFVEKAHDAQVRLAFEFGPPTLEVSVHRGLTPVDVKEVA
jgi:transcriptional regulator with XRE-family HTH domain